MPEPIRLIALTGRAGAGKDSVAATLVGRLNYHAIAFADALRAEIAEAWRIDARMLQDPATKEWPIPALAILNCGDTAFTKWALVSHDDLGDTPMWGPRSPRWIMQRWGDFQRLRRGDDYYALKVVRRINRRIGSGWTRFVVTDLRFQVEMMDLAVLCRNAPVMKVLRVLRPSLPAPTDRHASETDLLRLLAEAELVNDGTLDDLANNVLRMERDLFGAAP